MPLNHPPHHKAFGACAIFATGLFISAAEAATYTKANNGDALNLGTSWVGGTAPDALGNDTALFEAYNTTNELGGNLHWAGINKNNNRTHTFNDTSGNNYTLTLGSGGTSGGVSGNFNFNVGVVLSGNQSWDANASHVISQTLDNAGFNLSARSLNLTSTGVLSGSGNVIITGSSTFSGANTYTGSTTVSGAGVLYLDNIDALGNSATRSLTLQNGGTVAPDNNLALAGASPTDIILDNGGRILFDNITSEGVNQTLAINSDISGTGGLVIEVGNLVNNNRRVADVTLGGTNTYTGATTLRNTGRPTVANPSYHQLVVRNGSNNSLPTGTILTFDDRQGNNGELQTIAYDLNGFNQGVAGLAHAGTSFAPQAAAIVNSSGTSSMLTVSTTIDSTYNGWLGVDNYAGATPYAETGNNFGLTKEGSATLTLTADNSYTGATIINGGVLALTGTGGISDSSTIGIAAGAEFDVTGLASYSMLVGQTLTIDIDPTGSGSAGLLNAAGINLDITNGTLSLNLLGTLDDAAYVIANYGSLTQSGGDFDIEAPSGYQFDYSFNGGTQIALVEIDMAVIPEPSSFLLFGISSLGLLLRRRH